MRAQTSLVLVSSSLIVVSLVPAAATAQTAGNPSSRARHFFETLSPGGAREPLGAIRPHRISPEDRARALASLPPEGALHPDPSESAKLASIASVLRYHGREDVYETKLIDVPQAAVALHARAVLLISRSALGLLSAGELQALVAHEVGHEFFWQEYERARQWRDARALQELELKCDGIAALTFMALGLDPASLPSSVKKIIRFNERLGTTLNADWHPSLSERKRFVRDLVARLTDDVAARERSLAQERGRLAARRSGDTSR
jgi:Zn-dependent protease with chaperone function